MKKIDNINNLLNYYDQYEAESILLKIIQGMNISSDLLDLKLVNLLKNDPKDIADFITIPIETVEHDYYEIDLSDNKNILRQNKI